VGRKDLVLDHMSVFTCRDGGRRRRKKKRKIQLHYFVLLMLLTDCELSVLLTAPASSILFFKKTGQCLELFHGLLSRIFGENAQYYSSHTVHQTTWGHRRRKSQAP